MSNFRDSFSFYHEGGLNICAASPFLKKYIAGDDKQLFEDLMDWNPYSGRNLGRLIPVFPYLRELMKPFLLRFQ